MFIPVDKANYGLLTIRQGWAEKPPAPPRWPELLEGGGWQAE